MNADIYINNDAGRRRTLLRSCRHRQRGTVVDVVISSLLVLMAIALFVACLNFTNQGVAGTKAFIASPLCTSSDINSAACRLNVPMLVTRQYHVPGTKGGGYFLDLVARSGERETAEFRRSSRIWEAVSPGETVEAQLWQGSVVLVTHGTLRSRTVTSPDQPHLTHFFDVVTGLLLLLALGFLVSVIRRTSRGQRPL